VSWRGTLLLLALGGVALGFFLLSGRNHTRSPQEPLLGIDPPLAGSIQIAERGTSLSLIKKNGLWILQGAITDRANPKLIRALLETAADITPRDMLSSSDRTGSVSLTSLGLNKPNRSITFNDGKTHTLWLGVDGPSRGDLYARLDSGSAVYLIPGKIASLAFLPTGEYRDPILTELTVDRIDQVAMSKGATLQQLRFRQDTHGWMMESPLSARGEDEAVNAWLKNLLSANITRWMPEGTTPDSCGMDVPTATITLLEKGSSSPLTITIGSPLPDSSGAYFARCSDRPGICVLSGIAPSLSATPLSLRSKQIQQVEFDTIDKIEIADQMNTLTLTRKPSSEDWEIKQGGAGEISGIRIKEWFDRFQKLSAESFEPATGDHLNNRDLGPGHLPVTISFIARLSENTAQENAGETLLAQYLFGGVTDNHIALRVGNSNELMILPPGTIDLIKNEPLFWITPATPSTTPVPSSSPAIKSTR